MSEQLILEHVSDESLDAVLSLNLQQKSNYFTQLAQQHYPNVEIDSQHFLDLVETYISCFYLEKMYRCNRFLQEKFTPVYTKTGLIRNLTADIYFMDETLITH